MAHFLRKPPLQTCPASGYGLIRTFGAQRQIRIVARNCVYAYLRICIIDEYEQYVIGSLFYVLSDTPP